MEACPLKRGWIIAVLTGLWGCSPELPGPSLMGVTPDLAWNGEATTITLLGEDFYPQIQLDAGQKGRSTINSNYRAWLVGAQNDEKLSGVSVIDYTRISALIPEGVDPGIYGLRIVGPTGRSSLEQAFEVSNSKADHLRVQTRSGNVAWNVNEFVVMDIQLLDRDEKVVFRDPTLFPILVNILDSDGVPPVLRQLSIGLEDWELLPDGSYRGNLREGSGTLSLVSEIAQQLTVTVGPDDRSNVVAGSEDILFSPGESHLDIRLPVNNFVTVAGEPFDVELVFVDDFGNLDPQPHDVSLRGTCSNFSVPVNVTGPTLVTVDQTTRISGTDSCPEESLTSGGLVPSSSAPFQVVAAPTDHFDVQVAADPVAGEFMDVQLNARDAFGNPRVWLGINQEFVFQDNVDGIGTHSCVVQPFNVGEFRCAVETLVASASVALHVDGDDGTEGDSQVPYTVHPNPTPAALTATIQGVPVAGLPFEVDVAVEDAWANQIDAATLPSSNYQIVDELGEVSCASLGFGIDGSADFECVLLTARSDAVITVTLLAEGVQGSTPLTQVNNGELAAVVVDAVGAFQATEVQAGETIFLDLLGIDAYGNPYMTQTDPNLDLDDTTGTLSVVNAVLGVDGAVQLQATVTVAGNTQITASQASQPLGSSEIVTVLAAEHAALQVSLAEPWAWLGTPAEVRIQSVDAFGNRTDWTGIATLSSRETASPPVDVVMTNGVGVDLFSWSAVALDEAVLASTPTSLIGESPPLHVVQNCGLIGPTPDLLFGGFAEAVVCFDPAAGTGLMNASFAGSSGGAPLASYGLASDGPATLSLNDTLVFSLDSVGAHSLRGLVAQTDACAAEVTATAWVGLDDGAPVGPIPLTSSEATLDAGAGLATVDIVGVTDCSRDPASGGSVYVRTTHGDLSGVNPSGAGLVLTLDVNGDASFTLDAGAVTSSGLSEIHAWAESQAALGRVDVDIEGDNERPQVWSQDPTGEALTLVTEIHIVFSEAMLLGQMIPGNFSVTGPTGAVVDTVTLLNGGTEAVLTLQSPVDGALGTWNVTATDNLRDEAGNRLDGTWSGGASSYVGTFGDVIDPGDSVSCVAPDGGVFRPDGDDGAGAEADSVSVGLTTVVAPAWWIFSVTAQDTGALLRRNYVIPGGAVDTMTWDGRDVTGAVVSNGSYVVRVDPDDGLGNQGAGCQAVAIVDNILGEVP